jgi:hypothetical protein
MPGIVIPEFCVEILDDRLCLFSQNALGAPLYEMRRWSRPREVTAGGARGVGNIAQGN